jgi:hypothetical protein
MAANAITGPARGAHRIFSAEQERSRPVGRGFLAGVMPSHLRRRKEKACHFNDADLMKQEINLLQRREHCHRPVNEW